MKYTNKVLDNLKYHIVDSTAQLTEHTPIFGAFEIGIAKMSSATSMNARLLTAGITYGGIGFLYSKGRDLSRKLFKITDKTKEKMKFAHDVLYTAAFNIAVLPPIYCVSQTIAGENIDLKKMAIGTAAGAAFGGPNGSLLGYAIDVFRDLSGLQECNRASYPKFLKRQNPKVKKCILAGIMAASIGTLSLIYSLAPDKNNIQISKKPEIEQKMDVSFKAYNQSLENIAQEPFFAK